MKKEPNENNNENNNDTITDGFDTSSPCVDIRENNFFPLHRLFTDSQKLIIQGTMNSSISLDNITLFGIRPPELLHIFKKVGDYFRWFHVEPKIYKSSEIEEKLSIDESQSFWLDGIGKIVKLRYKAIPEVKEYLISINSEINDNESRKSTYDIIMDIINTYETRIANVNEQHTAEQNNHWAHIKNFWLHFDTHDHLPIPVFDYIKPNVQTRFILHILLSLGHFETEYDLLLQPNLRESLRYAKLIGPSNNTEDLQQYSNNLLKLFVEEQLVYYPNGKKAIESFILNASETFNSIIVQNEIPIIDMPPVLQANLDISKESQVIEMHQNMKKGTLDSIFMEIQDLPFDNVLERKEDFYNQDIVIWDPVESFKKTDVQTDDSYTEQFKAISRLKNALDRYQRIDNLQSYVKCQIICGFPGSGKTFIELYIALYAISKGLKICTTSIMCKRSVTLGGLHIHVLFGLPIVKNLPTNRIVELALINLLHNNEKLLFLRTINVIFLDEIGQVSAELLCVLDIILRQIRESNTYMGGILLIATLDHKQLAPVEGNPFLTTPHVFSCFEFLFLNYSVRSSQDPNHQRVQQII